MQADKAPPFAGYRSKAVRLSEQLREGILDGQWPVGAPLPPAKHLAKAYHVSRPTVHRALDILAEANYVLKLPQRGVVVADPRHQAGSRIAQIAFITEALGGDASPYVEGMTDCLDPERFALATYSAQADMQKYSRAIENIADLRPAGVIVSSVPWEICKVDGKLLARTGIPVVVMGEHPIPGLEYDWVKQSSFSNARIIADYILRHEIRDIAFLGSAPRAANQVCIDTLRKELARDSLGLSEDRVFVVDSYHGFLQPPDPCIDSQEYLARLLDEGFRCELLICGHDYPAVGALRALLAAGIKVPEEMKVISALRCAVEGMSPMRLTTVDFHRAHQGYLAAELLTRRIDGFDGPPEVHHPQVSLVEGDTTQKA
jgi:DNA-binding LacI/PurR family transcriptional regulator